jgi:hypothetical protein
MGPPSGQATSNGDRGIVFEVVNDEHFVRESNSGLERLNRRDQRLALAEDRDDDT